MRNKVTAAEWKEAKDFAARLAGALRARGLKVDSENLNIVITDRHEVIMRVRNRKIKRWKGDKDGVPVGTVTVRDRDGCSGGYYHRRFARLDLALNPPWARKGGHLMRPRWQFKNLSGQNFTKALELFDKCNELIERRDELDKEKEQQENVNAKWIKDWAHWIAGQIVGMEVEEVYGSRCRLKRGDVDLCVEANDEEGFSVKGSIVEIERMSREHATFELFKACYTAERDIRKLAYGVPID